MQDYGLSAVIYTMRYHMGRAERELKAVPMYQLAGVETEVTDLKAPLQELQVLLHEATGYAVRFTFRRNLKSNLGHD